jgi:N-acetylglutamate synthase-like GNAT family acetyltransferase
MKVISIREQNEYCAKAIKYFQKHWASESSMMVYEDCIKHSLAKNETLPQWYLLIDENENIIGCAGLITNDFISRMDLYPWLCALFIEEEHRGNGYPKLIFDKAMLDTKNAGFKSLYLCTGHNGYYEKYGFNYIGIGYHPWGEDSRIYKRRVV